MVNMLKTASLHHLQVWSWVLLEMQSLPIFILYRWQYTSHYTGIISHHNIYHFLLTKYIWPDESLCWGKHLCCAGQSHHKTVEDLGIALRQIYNHWIKMQYCPQRFSGKKINKKKTPQKFCAADPVMKTGVLNGSNTQKRMNYGKLHCHFFIFTTHDTWLW